MRVATESWWRVERCGVKGSYGDISKAGVASGPTRGVPGRHGQRLPVAEGPGSGTDAGIVARERGALGPGQSGQNRDPDTIQDPDATPNRYGDADTHADGNPSTNCHGYADGDPPTDLDPGRCDAPPDAAGCL
jgi:hypothetical protein